MTIGCENWNRCFHWVKICESITSIVQSEMFTAKGHHHHPKIIAYVWRCCCFTIIIKEFRSDFLFAHQSHKVNVGVGLCFTLNPCWILLQWWSDDNSQEWNFLIEWQIVPTIRIIPSTCSICISIYKRTVNAKKTNLFQSSLYDSSGGIS